MFPAAGSHAGALLGIEHEIHDACSGEARIFHWYDETSFIVGNDLRRTICIRDDDRNATRRRFEYRDAKAVLAAECDVDIQFCQGFGNLCVGYETREHHAVLHAKFVSQLLQCR